MQRDTELINSMSLRLRGGEKPPKSCLDLVAQTLGSPSSCAAGANLQLFPRPWIGFLDSSLASVKAFDCFAVWNFRDHEVGWGHVLFEIGMISHDVISLRCHVTKRTYWKQLELGRTRCRIKLAHGIMVTNSCISECCSDLKLVTTLPHKHYHMIAKVDCTITWVTYCILAA